uniref:Uncharacterized protein n=1 Tax=Anguilla anguilla TaxID=7936 RepID=A0A0E9UH37_ANGAN
MMTKVRAVSRACSQRNQRTNKAQQSQ